MSEANHDEVEKLKQIAQNAMKDGDNAKAIRFLQKASQIRGADASIDALLAQAQSGGGGAGAFASQSSMPRGSATGGDEGSRHRSSTASSSAGAPGPSTSTGGVSKDGTTYTSEQMSTVQRILRTKDYYDMLGLPKNSDEDAVKKAYKKLALKLHPDKNKAPGAEEAFKKVSTAVQCLTNPQKKDIYDRYGDEDRIPSQHRHYQQDFVTPEEFFAAFFSGGVSQHHRGEQEYAGGQTAGIVKMLPMLVVPMLLFLFSGSSSGGGSGSSGPFSFTANKQHVIERSTAAVGVSYYVADNFGDHYQDGTEDLAEFERQIEVYYVRNLISECDYQDTVMKKMVIKASRRNNEEELQNAKNHPRPACKKLENIRSRHNAIYRDAL